MEKELTILSVYHSPQSAKLLQLNGEFTRARNSVCNWEWLVADNTLAGSNVSVASEYFTVIEGVRNPPQPPSPGMRGSYQLAASLHKLLPHVKTRFAAIIDGDCYLVYPEWASTILGYMQKKSLAFLGVPWHTRWWNKIRYFPNFIHACFLDLDKIRKDELDFFPQYDKKSLKKLTDSKGKGRRGIGVSKDMGYAMYRRFVGRRDLRYECFTPVFRPAEEWGSRSVPLKRLLYRFIPDKWSYVPKRPGAFTETSFKDKGYFDARSYGWEEFMWKGEPFCFHLRKTGPRLRSVSEDEEFTLVKRALASFQTL